MRKIHKIQILVLALIGSFAINTAEAKPRWDVKNSLLKLPAPPSEGSKAYERDFMILFKYQNQRTEEECEISRRQGSIPSMKAFFGPETGLLSEHEFHAVEDFGNEVIAVVLEETKPFKVHYHRMRPYDANADIHPCTIIPGGHTSYPSSHAGAGWIMGKILSKLFPEKAKSLLSAGFKIGEYRVLGGVHHPSDVAAGRSLAKQILKELLKKPSFRKELKKERELTKFF